MTEHRPTLCPQCWHLLKLARGTEEPVHASRPGPSAFVARTVLITESEQPLPWPKENTTLEGA